ncbi:MAG: DUF2267 domain-containing protein [Dehalococcoidia bacterium]
MTVPAGYYDASRHFEEFLVRAREAAGLTTTNQSFTMVEGVFRAFRRRLSIKDAIRFAGVLPPAARALFVADWDPEEPRRPFEDRPAMTREAQALRGGHNFAPDTCIHDVAVALRASIREADLEAVLSRLPEAARDFWTVDT